MKAIDIMAINHPRRGIKTHFNPRCWDLLFTICETGKVYTILIWLARGYYIVIVSNTRIDNYFVFYCHIIDLVAKSSFDTSYKEVEAIKLC